MKTSYFSRFIHLIPAETCKYLLPMLFALIVSSCGVGATGSDTDLGGSSGGFVSSGGGSGGGGGGASGGGGGSSSGSGSGSTGSAGSGSVSPIGGSSAGGLADSTASVGGLSGSGGGGGGGSGSGTGSVTLTWTPPKTYEDNSLLPADDIKGYKIYYGTSSGVYTTTIDVGNLTTYPVTGLTSGTIYYFVVTCYAVNGLESVYSVEVIKTA